MELAGKVVGYDGERVTIMAPFSDTERMIKKNIRTARVILEDGRSISSDQRKKLYATFNDIADYTGYVAEEVKEIMKCDFIAATGCEEFSLSDVDMTTARMFLEHVIEFCIWWGIPTKDSLLERAPDVARYIYVCAVRKVCCISRQKAELHHVDAVGMGRNRKEIIHFGMEVIPLSPALHREIHPTGKAAFFEKYHVFGVKADEIICQTYKLKGSPAKQRLVGGEEEPTKGRDFTAR